MPYLGPPLDVPRFFAELPPAAQAAGFGVEQYGEASGWPLLALRKISPHADAPWIYLAAGIHGDEPAGPLALLRLLEKKYFGERHNWLICPALNPGGLAAKTRECPSGIDVNRDYRDPKSSEAKQHLAFFAREKSPHGDATGRGHFALCLLLHEDWESTGFYLYELNRTRKPLIGPSILEAVAPFCGVDRSPTIEGMGADNGLITRPLDGLENRPQWPEAIYLVLHHSGRTLTLESPSAQEMDTRVAALCVAVRTAIKTGERQWWNGAPA